MNGNPATDPNALHLVCPYPAASLWPNARSHWSRKARSARQQRAAVRFIASLSDRRPSKPFLRATVLAEFFCSGRGPDPDNAVASLKSTLDGLQDGRVLANDRELVLLPVRIVPRSQWPEHVVAPQVVLHLLGEST